MAKHSWALLYSIFVSDTFCSKCKEQKKRITELRNKINEMNEKKQNNNNNNEKIVENENIFFYNDSIDGQFDLTAFYPKILRFLTL